MKNVHGLLLVGCSALALAGCGAQDIASPGAGSITINNPTPAPTPTPTPAPTSAAVTPASGCPSINATGGLTDSGTITGPEGTWRVCTLPALIDVTSSLPKVPGLLYRMNGRVDVGCDGGFTAPTSGSPFATTTASCGGKSLTADTNVTLTIDPGVILYGENGSEPAWMAVNRGNKISAVGTATSPIIFTSRQNVVGLNSNTDQGQWGGVVLLGRGQITDCNYGTTTGGNCERDTEGSVNPAIFGGSDDSYNAGVMKYVQIRYSGYVLSAGKELQSLTGEGVGTGTTLDYFQSYNSSDDGSEWFGGKVNFKHYIAVNADDDSLDLDAGLRGSFQYVMLLQRPGGGDAMMEIDSNGDEDQTPRQTTTIANFIGIQPQTSTNNESNDQAAVLIRGNSDITFVNGIIDAPNNECIRLNGSSTNGSAPATLTSYSTLLTCNSTKYIGTGSYTATDTANQFASGTNNNEDAYTGTITAFAIDQSTATPYDASTLSSFFDAPGYVGAVKDSSDTWYSGWSCDSATASLGGGSSCTALPTT